MLEVRVPWINRERRAFKVDIDAVEAVFADNLRDGRDIHWHALRVSEGEMLATPAERDHDLLPLALQVRNVRLKLRGVETCGRMELHGAFGRVFRGSGEGDDDHVPLGRDLAQRKNGIGFAVAFPVTDQLVAIARAGVWDRSNLGRRWSRCASIPKVLVGRAPLCGSGEHA